MNNKTDLQFFQDLYGPERGMLRYILSTQKTEEEIEVFDNCNDVLEQLQMCQVHCKAIECVCLDQTCPNKGLICYICLMESHRPHAVKVFRIEEICKFIQENSIYLERASEDNGRSINKLLEEDTLFAEFEKFSSNIECQLQGFLGQMKIMENRIQSISKIKEQEVQQVLNQRLHLIASLAKYNENLSFSGMKNEEELKNDVKNKLTFLKKFIDALMEEFALKVRSAIEVTLKINQGVSLEKCQEELDKKPTIVKMEEEEEKKDQGSQDKSRKISEDQKDKLENLFENFVPEFQYQILQRLPHLPQGINSYWPITHRKKEKIAFIPLREKIMLVGFTQFKIMKFDAKVAKFQVKIERCKADGNDDEEWDYGQTSRGPRLSSTILVQEMEITPEENEECNFMLFNKKILLETDYQYTLELTGSKDYGCAAKYGVNNYDDIQSNDILKFQALPDERESSEIHNGFKTTLTQGLFPSLLYEREIV